MASSAGVNRPRRPCAPKAPSATAEKPSAPARPSPPRFTAPASRRLALALARQAQRAHLLVQVGALDPEQRRGPRDVPAVFVQLDPDVLALHVIAELSQRQRA